MNTPFRTPPIRGPSPTIDRQGKIHCPRCGRYSPPRAEACRHCGRRIADDPRQPLLFPPDHFLDAGKMV
jgi:DNA-directed RNA polymerase subunit RPC12/RpoP